MKFLKKIFKNKSKTQKISLEEMAANSVLYPNLSKDKCCKDLEKNKEEDCVCGYSNSD